MTTAVATAKSLFAPSLLCCKVTHFFATSQIIEISFFANQLYTSDLQFYSKSAILKSNNLLT